MPDINVKAFLDQLRQTLPHVPPVRARTLKSLHRKRDYEGMVRLIKNAMNVEVRLLVGWVNSGGPKGMENAPAWVRMPTDMPYYGTPAFKNVTVTIYLRRSFLEQTSYGHAAIAIAHELSHVVLDSIRHSLRREEKAVDLTAMLLGFSRLYEQHAHTDGVGTHRQLGYLSERELWAAGKILNPLSWRLAHTMGQIAWRASPLIALIAMGIAWAGGSAIYSKWQVREALAKEQATLQPRLPLPAGSGKELIATRLGLTSLTRIYRVTGQANAVETANELREMMCIGTQREMIKLGAAYGYEYHDPAGALIAYREIDSCP